MTVTWLGSCLWKYGESQLFRALFWPDSLNPSYLKCLCVLQAIVYEDFGNFSSF